MTAGSRKCSTPGMDAHPVPRVPRHMKSRILASALIVVAALASSCGGGGGGDGGVAPPPADGFSRELVFSPPPPDGDPVRGQAVFGIAADGIHGDDSQALFTGFSEKAGVEITANGRTCFSCHRPEANFMLNPLLPLDEHLEPDDALIRSDAVLADSAGNPDAPRLLNEFGLILIRPHRFKLPASDPRHQAFAWRKVPTNLNVVFARGFLNDLRGIDLPRTDLGASMSHTQNLDLDHDDMIPLQAMHDLAAFQATLLTDPALAPLAGGPGTPGYQTLVDDPFATVPVQSDAERRGRDVFARDCFGCHDVPNVFNNRAHRDPSAGAPIGQGFDIGVAQANLLGLDFRNFDASTGQRTVVELTLGTDDGATVVVPLDQDPGMALITGRFEDLGRFKVPQLRNLRFGKPYFHDGSVPDLEGVVAYFNSPLYNESADGRRFPIAMTAQEQADLLAFLRVL